MKKTVVREEEKAKLTPEKRKEIEAAYARRDLQYLRQSFASSNPAVSEFAERFVEQLLEQIRSERDRSDTFSLKKKTTASNEAETNHNDPSES